MRDSAEQRTTNAVVVRFFGQLVDGLKQPGVGVHASRHDAFADLVVGCRLGEASLGAIEHAAQFLLRRGSLEPRIELFDSGVLTTVEQCLGNRANGLFADNLLRVSA